MGFSAKGIANMIAKFTVGSEGLAGLSKAMGATEGDILGSLVKQSEKGSLSSIMSAFKGAGAEYSDEAAEKIAKMAGSSTRQEIVDELASSATGQFKGTDAIKEAIENYTTKGDSAKRYEALLKTGRSQADVAKYLGKEGDTLGPWNLAKGYFGDEVNGAMRKKVVGAGYAAGAVGLRVLSGGDLTHNARGENDIAGIPFV